MLSSFLLRLHFCPSYIEHRELNPNPCLTSARRGREGFLSSKTSWMLARECSPTPAHKDGRRLRKLNKIQSDTHPIPPQPNPISKQNPEGDNVYIFLLDTNTASSAHIERAGKGKASRFFFSISSNEVERRESLKIEASLPLPFSALSRDSNFYC